MSRSMHAIIPQWEYANLRGETRDWVRNAFKKSLSAGELTKVEGFRDNPLQFPHNVEGIRAFESEAKQREQMAHKMLAGMAGGVRNNGAGGGVTKAGGVTSALGYNFYDLRGPVQLLYPVNTHFRNTLPRTGRVNDGVGVAAHWKATRNPGITYGGVSEGNRAAVSTPDENDYIASYKELGVERAATYTAESASEGLTSVVADEHLRGLHEMFLLEEAQDLHGNSGTGSGNNGFQLGVCPTPTLALAATHTVGVLGNLSNVAGADLPYTTALTTSGYVTVYCVLLTAMGNPANSQYGYGVIPTIAGGLTPSYIRTNADGSKDTINGGMSTISLASSILQATTGNLTIKASVALGALKGVFGYAWFVDVEASSINTLANTKLAGITTVPYAFISGTATGTQTMQAAGLDSDHSFNRLDYDGLITYTASTAGATWTDLAGVTMTSQKNGRVTEIETILSNIWNLYQAGVDEIWGSADAVTNLDAAIRYSGTSNSGFQFVTQRDGQNNLLGGFVVSGYQSRYAMASATGANVIPIRIHPMVPPGTLFFHVRTNPYPHSRGGNVVDVLVQRDYYSIEWPPSSRQWTFGTYVHQTLRHNMPWVAAVLTGIPPFVGS